MTDSENDGTPPAGPRAPRAQLLSNGRMATFLTESGGGGASLDGYAITRWSPDRTRDADGFLVYLRDLDGGDVWSAGRTPVPTRPDAYEARLDEPGVAALRRLDRDVETTLEACVSPHEDVELRRVTLTNHGSRPRRLEATTYAEVVLNAAAADAAHPAFSKLFVQTEFLSDVGAIVARRRPRSPEDPPLALAHLLLGGTPPADGSGFETDRARFIGRGRTLAAPRALDAGACLNGTAGNVLDAVVSLRRHVELAPGASATLVSVLAAGATPEAAEALARRWSRADAGEAARVFDAARARAREVLDAVGLDADAARALPRLTGALLYGDALLGPLEEAIRHTSGQSAALENDEIPRGMPLVLFHATAPPGDAEARDMAAVAEWWRRGGLAVSLLIAGDTALRASLPAAETRARGRTIVVPGDYSARIMAAAESGATLVLRYGLAAARDDNFTAERAEYAENGGSRTGERRRPGEAEMRGEDEVTSVSAVSARSAANHAVPNAESPREPELRLFNGIGGFTPEGDEYVIRIRPGERGPELPPLPWTHVVANEEAGFIASERGGLHTWAANSRENRLTPWYNDPVSDPHGEALYVRDEESGAFWSPTPGPAPAAAEYEVAYGFGYARWRTDAYGIRQEVTAFVPRHGAARLVRVRLENHGAGPRRLSLFSYARLVLGVLPHESGRSVVTERGPGDAAILATNRMRGEFSGRVAFAAALAPPGAAASLTADRTAFLGAGGSEEKPACLRAGEPLDDRVGAGLDPCAAFRVSLGLAPGEAAECTFVLGEAEDEAGARELLARFRSPGAVAEALDEATSFWAELTSRVGIKTPSPALDLMAGGWLVYQDLCCRVWARTAYYQSGGAFGFRDQLQDAAALVYLDPEITRRQILLHAAHQFVEGDVLHWWHPPLSKGIRTRFSDDLLWLPYVVAFYLRTTGDAAVLDETARFVASPPLEAGQDEVFLFPEDAGVAGSVYEHCCRALDRSLTEGPHGLPLMGSGDWNDGMNRVGREGRGESVWLGFFLYAILEDWIPLARSRGDGERAERYQAYRERLRDALNGPGWDGEWYRRAYYDDGAPIGSKESDECRIDAIAQAWAVLSGAAPPARADMALDALEARLVDEHAGIIRLLTPAFDRTPHDPGYIKGYLPGVRENGGQYTHGALWAVRALAEAGRTERAAPLLEMLSPVSHARTPQETAVYRVEPYVVAADVYGVAPHVGRGGWTWYTGSAGWMLRVALESVLGLRIVQGRELHLRPAIPAAWPGFVLRYRATGDGGASYEIRVSRSHSPATMARMDGAALTVEEGAVVVPLARDGGAHVVEVELGADGGRRTA